MSGAPSEQAAHELNARLLRFRSRPDPGEAKALAEALLAAHRHGEARGVVVTVQPPEGEDAALLVLEGRAWLLDRDLVRAQATLLRAVRADPAHASAYRFLGEVLIERGDAARATKVLRRAIELDPSDTEAARLATRAEFLSEAAAEAVTTAPEPEPTLVPPPAAQPEPPPEPAPPVVVEVAAPRDPEPEVAVRPAPPVLTEPDVRPALVSGRPSPFPARGSLPPPAVAVPVPEAAPLFATVEPHVVSVPSRPSPAGSFFAPSIAAAAPPAAPAKPQAPPAFGRGAGAARAAPPPPRSALPRGATTGAPAIPAPVARPPSSPGSLTSPATPRSSPGVDPAPLPAPAQPGRTSSPGSLRAPRTSPGELDAPRVPRTSPGELDAPRAPMPGPMLFDTEVSPPSAAEDDANVAVPSDDAGLEAEVDVASIDLADAPPRPADFALGTEAAAATDAEQALEAVRAAGLFEEPASPTAVWSPQSEAEATGTRVRNALIGAWVVTLALGAGGYFGWQAWVARRHAQAASELAQARVAMEQGDHVALVSAERFLRSARELHPASADIPRSTLLLQCQRVLEDGQRDLGGVRTALMRARAGHVDPATLAVAAAVVSAFSPDATSRTADLEAALASAHGDPMLAYLVGRLAQRLGRSEASAQLTAAAQADKQLVPAQLALAEMDLDADERAEARTRIAAVVAQHTGHLRAKLLGAFAGADESDPTATLRELDALASATDLGAPTDKVLLSLTRARLLRRLGQTEPASQAVETASGAGADEPRLTAWVAREALALGKLALAQRAASQALAAAPDVPAYRRLLASVLVQRGDGEHALVLLDKLPADDVDAQLMKARAALLDGSESSLRVGLAGLAAAKAKQPDLAGTLAALSLRLQAKLEPSTALVDKARELVKGAPGDAEALLALAEAALAVRDAETATSALQARVPIVPGDATTQCMLGRARRMLFDAAGAEAAYRKALSLAPGDVDALAGLGSLLLDIGKFADADAVYEQLATRGASVVGGRLGRAEALMGLGRFDDAQVQLDAVSEAQRGSAGYRVTAARLALLRGKPGEAITLLRPLVDATVKNPEVLALYADALHTAEQVDAAAGAYDAAIALDPGLPEALIGRAEVHLRAERPGDAIAALETAQASLGSRLRPPALNARLLCALGHAYVMRSKHGDLEAARSLLRQAVVLPGAPIEAFFWMGESVGGKITPEARAAYQHYLAVDPSGKYADRARRALGPLL